MGKAYRFEMSQLKEKEEKKVRERGGVEREGRRRKRGKWGGGELPLTEF